MRKENSREILEKELSIIFDNYNLETKIINKVRDEFVSRGVSSGEILSIIDKTTQIETVPLNMLGLISILFYEETKEEGIKPDKYFTEAEIEEAKKFRRDEVEKEKYPLVFENVMQFAEDHYVTSMSAQELANLYARNIIVYNRQTQRNIKYSEYQDKVIEMININKSSVAEIEKAIIEGRMITNFITINLLQTGEEDYKYNAKSKTLTVYVGELDILDGFHRSLAIINAVKKVPNVKYTTGLNIVNWDVEKAQNFIVQEDKRNPIKKSYIKSISHEKYENMIVKKINETASSDIKGKITTDETLIRLNKALTTFEVLTEAVQNEYDKIKTSRDAIVISEWLIEFFNELVHLYPDAFMENIKEIKEKSYINHANMFVGYVALAKQLEGTKGWRDELARIMNNINFSLDNEIWQELKIDRFTKGNVKNISRYFINLVK